VLRLRFGRQRLRPTSTTALYKLRFGGPVFAIQPKISFTLLYTTRLFIIITATTIVDHPRAVAVRLA
jgi:hypothetical protein